MDQIPSLQVSISQGCETLNAFLSIFSCAFSDNSYTSLTASQEVLSLFLAKVLSLNHDNIIHFLLWRLEITYWTQLSKTS